MKKKTKEVQGRRHGGGREGASPPHSDYPAPSLKMSVKIDFIYEYNGLFKKHSYQMNRLSSINMMLL